MNRKNFNKILIANRAEIAARIIRTVHEMGKLAVAVYSVYDSDLPFVSEADESYTLGEGTLSETYLNQEKIIQTALQAGADAIHPGYGFLSENPSFAAKCRENGLEFIGPSEEAIRLMGNKIRARELAESAGIPVLKALTGNMAYILEQREELVYPVLVKPADGGGGKGMRVVSGVSGLKDALEGASREAMSYFGSAEVFVEQYLEAPRHIEVQVIADHHGTAVHLFERECTLQRRYQKIVEEAPSPSVSEELRTQITGWALELVRRIAYTSAGTVEFLVDSRGQAWFLEMNTRIQVEHPVTETITGIDLVREQIRIAQGAPLSFRQEDLSINGHAIEIRLYAEEPEKEFRPSTGEIMAFELPSRSWVRCDSGYRSGNRVEPWYDPLLAKFIVRGRNRDEARNRMISALRDLHLAGIQSNRDYLLELVSDEAYRDNRLDTGWIDRYSPSLISRTEQKKKNFSRDDLLGAAVMLALEHNYNPGRDSVWYGSGFWRLLPELILSHSEDRYRLHYEMLGGRREIILSGLNERIHLKTEQRTGNHFRISSGNRQLSFWGFADRSDLHLDIHGLNFILRRPDIPDPRYISANEASSAENRNEILAPLPGKIVEIMVAEGQEVQQGESLLIIESMKMENRIVASRDGKISRVYVQKGDQAEKNKLLILLEQSETN
ncbi:MAG: acetyl/propionyl/methylcrotonyl-CoA carboxylase subunit alpha [Bacteroidota bacterium]